jgi:CRISPR-associated protein Cas2
MTVLILERVSASLRGDLSRWLVEVRTGVFVGRVTARVRDALWERCREGTEGFQRLEDTNGTVIMLWSAAGQQGFEVRTLRPYGRIPVNCEGVWLSEVPDSSPGG